MQLPPDQAVRSTVTAVWSGDGGDVGGGVGVCVCVCACACVCACTRAYCEREALSVSMH